VVWAVLVFLVIIEVEPSKSWSVADWALLIVFGPPVYVTLESIGEYVSSAGKNTSVAETLRDLRNAKP